MWDMKARCVTLDARSLYTSAIHRICNPTPEDNGRVAGFPTGPAVLIENWSQHQSFSHYIARINVTAINTAQQISFVSYSKDGLRVNTNDVCSEMRGIVVDKITLEDWIQFQQIEYEFIEGVYWSNDNGRDSTNKVSIGNCKAGEFVTSIYSFRKECIENGNTAMSEICKLALNSVYGKTISKPVETKTVIKDKREYDEYISDNWDNAIKMEECHRQWILSMKSTDVNHSSRPHVGGLVLSMSKRIMHEVMDVANQMGIAILYTDTDSLHIVGETDELEAAYETLYKRKLIGPDMGQFARELKFPGHIDIYSERAIILGKKAYMHVVSGVNERGVRETYEYCRMKGVNEHAMSEYPDREKLYERMYAGEKVPFDLCYGNGVSFQFRDSVITRECYVKRIGFEGEKGVL